ncbi:hypothetical protein AGABI1DRAFT_78024 [Agaricus bisporus var. burnettii JB137-S8]|uniref:Uncharacterized protein n=1 Tax=Agaricus bisporus var. burnettii (strain JB137-S8 / ATCC MYA-4627 / FGSC 10392) TaxID=597362 RepID=K5X1W3_AGABU|nr:uncharacterized protein AGABI1DRAFT_78024 [Agaricus bisporus var. burnettii JB137-S8]EKM76907.1 hypothetical protein AGABI1DRAFT_78024 [Agaricus bisporus var. burnettii JB137-S8]
MALRVALVTGASRGIGEAISRRLATDGFDIAMSDLPSLTSNLEAIQRDIASMGRRAYIHTGDVSKEHDVSSMVQETMKNLGGLHVMVANAGIMPLSTEPLGTVDMWQRVMAVNGLGSYLCYKYAAEAMIKQKQGGRIIGASSFFGKQGAENVTAYAASKFAVRGLTQSAARELGKYDITVNAYAPGFIETPLQLGFGMDKDTLATMKRAWASLTALGRPGQPDDIASLVSFLASQGSGYITGQTISVNGGSYFD